MLHTYKIAYLFLNQDTKIALKTSLVFLGIYQKKWIYDQIKND